MADEELRAMIDEFDRDGDGESKIFYLYPFRALRFSWQALSDAFENNFSTNHNKLEKYFKGSC